MNHEALRNRLLAEHDLFVQKLDAVGIRHEMVPFKYPPPHGMAMVGIVAGHEDVDKFVMGLEQALQYVLMALCKRALMARDAGLVFRFAAITVSFDGDQRAKVESMATVVAGIRPSSQDVAKAGLLPL